ncbi:MAG: T9SS type A sorting domain-containing protein [Chitinophagales bacterium]
MKKISILLFFLSMLSLRLFAQSADWSTSVATIIYNNCSVCHHTGAIAPFPLMSYQDAVDWSFSIQTDVNIRKMPPWPPDPNYNHLYHERVLSDDEIASINDWVDNGSPLGDTTLAPDPPVFTDGNSEMVNASDTLQFAGFEVIEQEVDVYRTFVIHSGWTTTKYINQIEFLPSNPAIVHHVFIYWDSSNISFETDSLYPEVGFPGGGQGGFSPYTVYFAGWTPGSTMLTLPANMGFQVAPGSDFALTVHYAPGSAGLTDSMMVKVKFCDLPDSLVRPVYAERWLFWHPPSLIDGPLTIPANEVKTFHEKTDSFITDLSIVQLQPHSHLICTSWKVFLVNAPGDTTNLISIPKWDFNWQMGYLFTKLIKVPVNSQIWGEATFDNTTNNPDNPSNPPELVTAGETTFDEMMACRFSYLDYLPGDENIILDSSYYGFPTGIPASYYDLPLQLFPNPANDQFGIITNLPEHQLNWTILDVRGVTVKSNRLDNVRKGAFTAQINVSDLSTGLYFFTIQSGSQQAVRKITIAR